VVPPLTKPATDEARGLKARLKDAASIFRQFPGTFRLVWEANKRLTLAVALLTLGAAMLPAALAWVGKLIIDGVVAAAKGAYDAQSAELTQISANIAALDRVLANYGPETKEIRDLLHGASARILDQLWGNDSHSAFLTTPVSAAGEVLYNKIQALSPQNNTQSAHQGQALSIVMDTGRTRCFLPHYSFYFGDGS
jgi:hypothetical protein